MTWIRPVAPGGQVTATGECVHTSPTLALSTARVTDDDGQLVAHATAALHRVPTAAGGPRALRRARAPDGAPDPYLRPLDAPVPPPDPTRSGRRAPRRDAGRRGAAAAGRPPLAFELEEVGDRSVTVAAPCSRWLCGPAGSLQGGVLAVLAHRAASAAADTTVAAGGEVTAVDLKVNLLRPVPPSHASLSARGEVTYRGRACGDRRGDRSRRRGASRRAAHRDVDGLVTDRLAGPRGGPGTPGEEDVACWRGTPSALGAATRLQGRGTKGNMGWRGSGGVDQTRPSAGSASSRGTAGARSTPGTGSCAVSPPSV